MTYNPDDSTFEEEQARNIGRDLGTAAGSWVVDGNTKNDQLRAVIQASEDGEFYDVIVPEVSGPLSGEWADGYSTYSLSQDLGIAEDDPRFDDLCTILEDAYFAALEDEAVRSAQAMLPEKGDR